MKVYRHRSGVTFEVDQDQSVVISSPAFRVRFHPAEWIEVIRWIIRRRKEIRQHQRLV